MIFTFRQHIYAPMFRNWPRLVDESLDGIAEQVAMEAWRAGYSPGRPEWDMWMERLGEGMWMPMVEVRITGTRWAD